MSAAVVQVDFNAQVAQFGADVKKVTEHLDGIARAFEHADKFSEKFAEGLGIGSGMEAWETGKELIKEGLEEIKQAFEEVGQIGRNALRVGVSAEEMSRFQHAANATHTDVTALTNGMDHLNREIGKVASGDKSAAQAAAAFKKLGIDIGELSAQNPGEAFKTVASALGNVHSAFERAAISQEIFGRGGKELAPVMANLQGLMNESDGIGFTRTAEDIEKAEAMERNMAASTDALKGALMDLASSDFSSGLVKQFSETAASLRELPAAIGSLAVSYATAGQISMDDTTSKIADLSKEVEAHANRIGVLQGKIATATREMNNTADIEKHIGAARELAAAYKELYPLTAQLRGEQSQQEGHSDITFQGIQQLHDQANSASALLANLQAVKAQQDQAAAAMEANQKAMAKAYDKNLASLNAIQAGLEKKVDTSGMTEGQKAIMAAEQLIHDKRMMFQNSHIAYYEQERAADDAKLAAITRQAHQADALAAATKRAAKEAEQQKHIMEDMARLQDKVNAAGDPHKQKDEELKRMGATPAEIAKHDELQAQADAMAKAYGDIHGLLEQSITPLEKFNRQVQELTDALQRGKITQQEYDRAKSQAEKNLAKSDNFDPNKRAGALVRRFDFGGPQEHGKWGAPGGLAGDKHSGAGGMPGEATIKAKSAAEEAAKYQKDAADTQKQMLSKLTDIWSKFYNGMGGTDNSTDVVDFL